MESATHMQVSTPSQIALAFQCTEAQARAQLRTNAENFRTMAAKAAANKNGMHRGYTQKELETLAHNYMSASMQK
jgi:hypothetical protein